MVSGYGPTILAGLFGALIQEVLWVATALKAGKHVNRTELLGSLLTTALGACIVVFGVESRRLLEAAMLGASFPLLWSTGVRAVTTSDGRRDPTILSGDQPTKPTQAHPSEPFSVLAHWWARRLRDSK